MSTEENRLSLAGVTLGDVYRDKDGAIWEVIGLCDEPQATVRRVASGEQEQHVIGCQNWNNKWSEGPLRAFLKAESNG